MADASANGPVHPGDLFVFYGLLKQGAAAMPKHIDLDAAGRFLGPCRFLGDMYDLDDFPGVIDGDTLCHGVLYRLDDVSIVAALDAFEDVFFDDPAGSLYVRRRVEVLDDAGLAVGTRAWMYVYNQSVADRRRLASGDWPLHRGAR